MRPKSRTRTVLEMLALTALISTSGCLTDKTLTAAQEYKPPKEISAGVTEEAKEAKPGYYALLPFAVMGDIALAPVHIVWWIVNYASTGRID